ncbi:MAG: peptidoglycan-binding protein [Oscillospiraceae bacterium]|nr:peptidoglycan-binding protein [Oscillospiraceae bacterium]
MKKILSILLVLVFLMPLEGAFADASFAQEHGFNIVPARAFDGLMEETAADDPGVTPGIWSASMSQPEVKSRMPEYDGRAVYTVVYTLRTGKKAEVLRSLLRKDFFTDVKPHELLPMDAYTGKWIQETNAYIPYVTMPSRSDKNVLEVPGGEVRVYFTSETEMEVGEPEWDGLTMETPVIVRVSYTFNVPADYDGLLLAIHNKETTHVPPAEEEPQGEEDAYAGVFYDLDHVQEWTFLDVRRSAQYEPIYSNTFSDSVNFLQQYLIEAGYQKPGTADGSYGPLTVKAVSALQEASGLPVTGEADSRTIQALMDLVF